MARQPKVTIAESPARVQEPDAGVVVYRDRAGPARGVPLSEGRDNFSAITAEAIKTVQLAAHPEVAADA